MKSNSSSSADFDFDFLYGAAVSTIPKAAAARLKARLAVALDQRMAKSRPVDAVLDLAAPSEICPTSQVLAVRAVAFRRMWWKKLWFREHAREVWEALCQSGHPGCHGNPNPLAGASGVEANPGLWGERAQRAPQALLLHSLASFALQADCEWKLYDTHGGLVWDLLEHPWQQVGPWFLAHAARLRHAKHELRRPTAAGNGALDTLVLRKGLHSAKEEQQPILRKIHAQGLWTGSLTKHFREGGGLCPWCGECEETPVHLFWECRRFEDLQSQIWGASAPDPASLPPALAGAAVPPEL